MSNHIDTRDGTWTEGEGPTAAGSAYEQVTLIRVRREGHGHAIAETRPEVWHRDTCEEPVPPLPTEPYTVIRATWRPGGDGAVKETYVRTDAKADWCNVNSGVRHSPAELRAGITDFEVLAEPRREQFQWEKPEVIREQVRRETARSVLDRVRSGSWTPAAHMSFDVVAREFGVTA